MKKKIIHVLILTVFVTGIFASCKKDTTVTLTARFEKAPGSKAYITNNYACWSNGDQVQINGTQYTVSVTHPTSSTQYAVIEGVASSSTYYALYPASYGSNFHDGASIKLPSELTYQEVSPGVQLLTTPMVAKADADTVLNFTNLCTLLEVVVPPSNAILTNIMVQSSSKKLAGPATVTYSGDTPTLGAITSPLGSNSVTMSFGANGVSVQSGKTVYIPIPPVTAHETLTIYVVNKSDDYNDTTLEAQVAVPANSIVRIDAPQVPELSDYDLRQWLWSQESGYIDLGLKPKVGSKMEIIYELGTGGAGRVSQYICGSRGGGGAASTFGWFNIAGSQASADTGFWCTVCGNMVKNCVSRGGWRREVGKKYSVVAEVCQGNDAGGDYVYGVVQFNNITDGLTRTDTTGKYYGTIPANVNNILVFAISTANIHKSLKIYSFKYYEGTTLKHDYYPCICHDGGIHDGDTGMYDNVGANGFKPTTPNPNSGTHAAFEISPD